MKFLAPSILVLIFFIGLAAHAQVKKTPAPKPKPTPSKTATKPAEPARTDNFAVMETEEVRFPGTDEQLVLHYMKGIDFDQAAIEANAEGEVLISFTVNPDSTVSNPILIKKFGFNVDDQVLELTRKLKFVPRKMNGVITRSTHMISIPLRAYMKEKEE